MGERAWRREETEKEQNVKWLSLSLPRAVKTGEGCGELGRKMPWIRGNDSRSLWSWDLHMFSKMWDIFIMWYLLIFNLGNWFFRTMCEPRKTFHKYGPPIWNYSSGWQLEKCKSWLPPPQRESTGMFIQTSHETYFKYIQTIMWQKYRILFGKQN